MPLNLLPHKRPVGFVNRIDCAVIDEIQHAPRPAVSHQACQLTAIVDRVVFLLTASPTSLSGR